jgi:uncharacterized protein
MNIEQLQSAILDQFVPGRDSIHGPSHWQRVEAFGLKLAEGTDANIAVIRLFALFHDACRHNDGGDRDHGPRGAELATRWRGLYFSLPDAAFDQLTHACRWHTHRRLCDDLTVAICWDADRLDLTRIGATINPYYLNTAQARQLATQQD